jgi:hypothetical protein
VASGSVTVSARSGGLIGAGVIGREKLCCLPTFRLDFLLGYRFLRFDDELRIGEDITAGADATDLDPGTRIQATDSYSSRNEFHGADLGFAAQWDRGGWYVDVVAKVAVGRMDRNLEIAGSSIATPPGGEPTPNAGGLLALSPNSGFRGDHVYTAVPEFRLTLGRQITPRLRAEIGYNLLVLSRVVRASEQVSVRISEEFLPTGETTITPDVGIPPDLRDQTTWVQGLNFGLEFRY